MLYLPTNLINNEYNYYLDNNGVVIETSTGICKYVDITKDYIVSDDYSCDVSNLHSFDFSLLTDNYFYKNNICDSFIIFSILAIFTLYLPYRIFARLFGRWLKF